MSRDSIFDYQLMFEAFQKKPSLFFKEVLGIEHIEDYQGRVIQDVADFERVCIAACHDLGKTFLMARIVIWFCICFPYSKVITTAPTYNQVKNILWSEIRSAHARARYNLGGRLNLTDWNLTEEGDWFALGFTPRAEVQSGEGQGTSSSFQGFHAPYIMVIFDEATGIPAMTWTMAEGLLTSQNVKFVAIGNPTSKNSEFYRCFQSAAWHKIYLTCFNSPNLIANGITDMAKLKAELQIVKAMPDLEAQKRMAAYLAPRPYLLSLKWVVASILKWGIEHPLTVSKIFGEFPESGDNALVPLGFVEKAQYRGINSPYIPVKSDRKTLGVDVARYGSDSTYLTGMHGKQQTFVKEFFKFDLVEVTGEVINAAREMNWPDVIVVDETGLGAGVVDNLREAQRNKIIPYTTEIRGVQFGAKANEADNAEGEKDREKFYNIKARMFSLLRDDIKDADGIRLLNEAVYLEELPSIVFKFNTKGQMVIESKDDYKKRTSRKSPDASDSLALANFGHYDEMQIGTFDKSIKEANKSTKTRAGGLRSGRDY